MILLLLFIVVVVAMLVTRSKKGGDQFHPLKPRRLAHNMHRYTTGFL